MKNATPAFGLALAFIVLVLSQSNSQDLIVTRDGDSLNCKITKTDANNIYFTFKYNDEIRKTLMPLSQVQYQQYNFFATPEIPKIESGNYKTFRAAVQGGWSYRTGRISDIVPPDLRNYISELKSGGNFGLDLTYFITEELGFGFKYQNYSSKNSVENVYITDPIGGYSQYGRMRDNIAINFAGPSFCTRTLNRSGENALIASMAIGYLGYNDDAVLINSLSLKGSTVGMGFDFGYDIGISEDFAIGFQISFMMGVLTKYKLSSGHYTETIILEKENYENLSHFDFSVGLRMYK